MAMSKKGEAEQNELSEVARQLQALREELKNSRAEEATKKNTLSAPTFGQLAKRWFEIIEKQRVDPNNERRNIEKLCASLGGLTEETLTSEKIQKTLLSFKGRLAPETINKLRSTGKLIITHAQFSKRWGGVNPFTVVKRHKKKKRKYVTLTPDEFARMLPYISERERPAVIVAFCTGVRPGELVALQKVDVDFRRRSLHINRSHGRDETKTGEPRTIPIPDSILELLKIAVERSPNDLVFPGPGDKRYRKDFKWTRKLQWALVQAGIVEGYKQHCNAKGCKHKETTPDPEPRFCPTHSRRMLSFGIPRPVRFYDLRHSMVTNLREAKADSLAVKIVAGHAPSDVNDELYSHMSDDFIRQQLNLLRWRLERR